jgi:5,5'-dehydrodivanillate O-demethylase
MFDAAGSCIDQPNEPEGSTFKDKVSVAAYEVRVAAGMLFVYMGPLPAPQITLLDGYVVDPALRMVGSCVIPCNWLQIMENSVDPIHSEWLHGHLQEFVEAERGTPTKMPSTGRHVKIAFDDAPFGIVKRRLKEGQTEDCDDWRVGHPVVFPNILAVGNGSWQMYEFQVRVPIDDEHTLHVWFTSFAVPPGIDVPAEVLDRVHYYDVPPGSEDSYDLALVDHQDVMAWVTQGDICDRRLEHLGATDRGVTMYRRMLQREYAKIAAGADPINVFRGTEATVLDLPVEKGKAHYNDTFERYIARKNWRYSPIVPELIAFFKKRDELAAHASV